jgi:conjugal transfer pilus assembly protein TraK
MKSKHVLLSLLLSTLPAGAGLMPTIISVPAGGQADIRISSTNPNYFEVPGDRITGVTSAPGMLTDKRNTGAGGAFMSTTQSKPFTLYLTTEGGQTFSLNAHPESVPGRSYLLASQKSLNRDEAKAWETSQPYEKLLVELNRSLVRNSIPQGYAAVAFTEECSRTPVGIRATATGAWEGGNLRVVRFLVTNPGSITVSLREQDFWQPGVRAVMFSTPGRELSGGGSATLYVTSGPGGSDGQR